MFREMRRFKQQVSQDECKKILKDEKRAAFSVIGDEGYPYTIPINFYFFYCRVIFFCQFSKTVFYNLGICDKFCFSKHNNTCGIPLPVPFFFENK